MGMPFYRAALLLVKPTDSMNNYKPPIRNGGFYHLASKNFNRLLIYYVTTKINALILQKVVELVLFLGYIIFVKIFFS